MEWFKKSTSNSENHGNKSDVKENGTHPQGLSHAQSQNQLDNLIADEEIQNEQQTPSQLEVLRLRTLKFMASSWFGHIYTNFFLLMSVFSCAQYIYQTYLTDDQQVRY